MDEEKFFVNKSTVPVGTGAECKEIIEQELEKRGMKFTKPPSQPSSYQEEGVPSPGRRGLG